MSGKSVLSSCAVIVLSAVLSTGWAATADQTQTGQTLQTGGPLTQTNILTPVAKPDTNVTMKKNEQELIDSQGYAGARKTAAENLKVGTQDGTVLNKPIQDIIDAENAAKKKLAEDQKAFCAKMAIPAQSWQSDPANYCAMYITLNAALLYSQGGASMAGIDRFCFVLGTVSDLRTYKTFPPKPAEWLTTCKRKY